MSFADEMRKIATSEETKNKLKAEQQENDFRVYLQIKMQIQTLAERGKRKLEYRKHVSLEVRKMLESDGFEVDYWDTPHIPRYDLVVTW